MREERSHRHARKAYADGTESWRRWKWLTWCFVAVSAAGLLAEERHLGAPLNPDTSVHDALYLVSHRSFGLTYRF